VLLLPVVQYPPALGPTKTLFVAIPVLISTFTVPALFLPTKIGVDTAVIRLNETSDKVPLKSVVGVIVNAEVSVAVGPKVPVTVMPTTDCPPTATVILPAVLPVMTQLI
jgi:hypothetical protein